MANDHLYSRRTSASGSGEPASHQPNEDRRAGIRYHTVYRTARVIANGDHGLATVLNISDEGMLLSSPLSLCIGDPVTVDLSETCSLTGAVAWRSAPRCGISLAARIDSCAVLERLGQERSSGHGRSLRLPVGKSVLVTSELGMQIVRLRNISQRGMNVMHDGRFYPGLPVKVRLPAGAERRGVVRWSRDGIAGIALTEILAVDELGSVKLL